MIPYKIRRFLINLLENNGNPATAIPVTPLSSDDPLEGNWRNRTQLNIYHAHGGKIIETVKIDKKTDNRVNTLYIIDENEDFTESLAKIITMDALR
jgi:hypothetical protein